MALFSNKQESNLRSCILMVESVIRSLGHSPEGTRVEPQGPLPAWRVRKGSALVTVSIDRDEEPGSDNLLRVVAPVMILDKAVNRVALFRRLLELNAGELKGVAFALERDRVLLVAERSTVDLDLSEVHDLVARVEDYADTYDDALVAEFGGQIAGESPGPR
jgi:hypothetical protein